MTGPSSGPRRPAWYRRRGPLVVAGAAVVVAVSVGFDVGGSTTSADRASDLRSYARTIDTDVASCNSAVSDSLAAYLAVVHGQSGQRATAEGIIAGDEPECTPESNSDLYDFTTTAAPASLRAYGVQTATDDVGQWAYPTAAAVINDLGRLLAGDSPAARADLRRQVADLQRLSAGADRALSAAASRLGTHVGSLDLGASGGFVAAGL